ncbi:hypothetical protein [Raoultibacter phocaeensis]|uniref:hypothetical protein n=1 Tax=Raoultibacter phocaeensis TaxID=2479841 RepID=UPI0015D59D39|nr:hypothetical protein [Raoultibacter phocaeensis]
MLMAALQSRTIISHLFVVRQTESIAYLAIALSPAFAHERNDFIRGRLRPMPLQRIDLIKQRFALLDALGTLCFGIKTKSARACGTMQLPPIPEIRRIVTLEHFFHRDNRLLSDTAMVAISVHLEFFV